MSEDLLHDHVLGKHSDSTDGKPEPRCGYCQTRPLMDDIWAAWGSGDYDLIEIMWSLQDGYGSPGFVPVQGYDWSGVRDSTPDALRAIYRAIKAHQAERDES